MNEQAVQSAVRGEAPKASGLRSVAILVFAWIVLQLSGLFSPGLLDDVDSVYIEVAREMLHRHDFVTPYVDGIRFFDKPPLMYWMAAGSMRVLGEVDWAARLPLALSVLALLLSVYRLGTRLLSRRSSPQIAERGGFYGALVMATAIGPYLYTRFFIPDILVCLWMTLGVELFLTAVERARHEARSSARRDGPGLHDGVRSSLLPSVLFAVVLALNLLTKGFIGLVFPLLFVALYLVMTRQLRLLPRLHLISSALVFACVALPWHLLASLRNPAIAMPAGLGLPPRAGWAWFYLYNEHVARFLSRRIPHDYGQTPVWLFWLYAFLWIMPWAAFLPALAFPSLRTWRHHRPRARSLRAWLSAVTEDDDAGATFVLLLWTLIVLVFFTFSARQEYYSLPALPALAILVGGLLVRAESEYGQHATGVASASLLFCHRWLLIPVSAAAAIVCGWFALTAPHPALGTDLSSLLAANPELYNLSLGHLFDLTGAAMGLFRAPLTITAIGLITLGPGSYLLRRQGRNYAANLSLAGGMIVVLLAAHEGLVRFNPILGSKGLARAIAQEQTLHSEPSLILLDGELTSGSSVLFYTRQPVHLVEGRMNGLWFGSFWPDAPKIFEDEASLRSLWPRTQQIFLLTYNAEARRKQLLALGPVRTLAAAGGKTVLTNR